MLKKKAAFHNLGCKVNAYEMEAMQEMLEKEGYEIVPFQEAADIYIINTCTVTNIADRKSRQMLHRARKMNPEAVIVATGCYVQAQEDAGHPADPCVDIIIGNNKKGELPRLLREAVCGREKGREAESFGAPRKTEVIDIRHAKEYEELHLDRPGEHTRAYLKVQDGCNQFCSYCIIPYARGRVRSRRMADVVEEVARLAENGCQEIVLTGIHLSSYGIDLKDSGEPVPEGGRLLALIRAVHEVQGIRRIRLGSLEPRIITEEFVEGIAALPKLCPHFHLSLQSGCDGTLRRMQRRYTSSGYYEKCCLLREHFSAPALTTDVIVGFPGETEEEFAASKAFIDKVDFYETHIFKYSRREGTKAAAMDHQVPEEIKARRSNELIELGQRKKRAYEKSFLGRRVEVLVEEKTFFRGKEVQVGHTREYMKIALDLEEDMRNRIVEILLESEDQIM